MIASDLRTGRLLMTPALPGCQTAVAAPVHHYNNHVLPLPWGQQLLQTRRTRFPALKLLLLPPPCANHASLHPAPANSSTSVRHSSYPIDDSK